MTILVSFSIAKLIKSIIFWGLLLILLFFYLFMGDSRKEAKRKRKLIKRIEREGLRTMPERYKAIKEGKEDPWPKRREELMKKLKEDADKDIERQIDKYFEEED